MFDWVSRLFGSESQAQKTVRACQTAHHELDAVDGEIAEIDKALKEAEANGEVLDDDLRHLKEQGEALIMETHDAVALDVDPSTVAQAYVAKEVRKSWLHIERKIEAQEDLVIALQLKRARLAGEHRKAEYLLSDLSHGRDPLAGISVGHPGPGAGDDVPLNPMPAHAEPMPLN